MIEINNARFCFTGKYYVHVFSIGEKHPQFEEVSKIAETLKSKYQTFKPIYTKEVNGKKFISVQVRGINKFFSLEDADKGNTYDLKVDAYEKDSNDKTYLNLYCSGIALNTKKEKEPKADLGKAIEF